MKLLPDLAQEVALLATLERANQAANFLSRRAWETGTFRQCSLHRLSYHETRERFALSAQMVVRLEAKVADAYKLDRKRQRRFRPHGAIAYDERILRFGEEAVSIWTLEGRRRVRFVCGDRQRWLLNWQQGESDLVYRDGAWYLYTTAGIEEPPPDVAEEWLGVDLGIVNIAVDSDAHIYAGAEMTNRRRRNFRMRQRLQRKRTRSAKRLLRRRRRRERRQAADINHRIAKSIVRDCERTHRGVVFEDLKNIRARIRARRSQRRTMHSWAFSQLQSFVAYKARMAGVPVLFVDPGYSSQTCPECGHVARGNRPNQSTFHCEPCGLAGLADHIAALNLRARGRGAVNRPDVACDLPSHSYKPPASAGGS